MIPSERIPAHPGEVLLEEFLRPMGLTQSDLARHLGIPVQRVNEIINGRRGVTPETAWLLARTFETSAEFWMNLQAKRDLALARTGRRDVKPIKRAG